MHNARKGNKMYTDWEDIKLSLSAEAPLYVENLTESTITTKTIVEPIKDQSNVAGHKVNIFKKKKSNHFPIYQ